MNIQNLLNEYYEASSKVSELSRHYAFAGIALVWILKGSGNGIQAISEPLIGILTFFVISLFLDFLQYIYKTIFFYQYHAKKENDETGEGDDFTIPTISTLPTNIFFFGKIISLIMGYINLLQFLFGF